MDSYAWAVQMDRIQRLLVPKYQEKPSKTQNIFAPNALTA